MIESYQIRSSTETILKRFSVALNEYTLPIKESCTIQKGCYGYVITNENDKELRRMKFGLTPHWSKKPMDILTARAEGDKNPDNDPFYNGSNSIFLKPAFKKAIQNYRCLIVADAFTDNSNNRPQLLTFQDKQFPNVFAGIYDYWKDPETGIIQSGFAIITVPSSGILQHIGIKRMPVILSFYSCSNWIKPQKHLNYYLPMLDRERVEMGKLISMNDEPASQKPTQSQNATSQGSNPLPVRHYSKRQRHTPYNNETLEDMVKRSQR